jgi:hypothetical protein
MSDFSREQVQSNQFISKSYIVTGLMRGPDISCPAPLGFGWHRRPACAGRRLAGRN